MLKRKWYLMEEAPGDGGDGGGGATAGGTPGGDAASGSGEATPASGDPAAPAASAAPPPAPKGVWPDNWREQWAKDDAKKVSRLQKYSSPEAAFDALLAAQNRISAGQIKEPFPKEGSDQDKAAWRKANGVPDAPEKYDIKLPEGVVASEDDQKLVDQYLKSAFDSNIPREIAMHNVAWHFAQREALLAQQQETDVKHTQEASDLLNKEWGGHYRENMNMVKVVLDKFPDSVRDRLQNGRLADGRAIFNDPDVLRAFSDIAREITGGASVVPAGGGDPMTSISEEIASIEKSMRENRSAYNRDEKMQGRYRELLEAREKIKERKAA